MATRTLNQSTTTQKRYPSSPGAAARPWLAAWLLLAVSLPFGAAPVSGHSAAPSWPGPIADWVEDITGDLEDADDALADAKAAVGNSQGPLQEPDKTRVANDLTAALAVINRILDPNQYPSLDPPDAGEVLTKYDPTTLPYYARDCSLLAQDAVDELRSAVIDHWTIGSDLKTIRHLITRASPHNYRTKAGIGTGG